MFIANCKYDEMYTLTDVLEWGLFEGCTIVLLVAIFLWMLMGDGAGHFRRFLKTRGTASERLDRKLMKTIFSG